MVNENNTSGIDDFVGDFEAFHKAIRQKAGEIENEQIVTLYAIYLKNGRAEALNGNGNGYGFKKKSDPNAPATDKQKNAIKAFIRKGKISPVDAEKLTKTEASKILGEVFGRGKDSSPSYL